MNIGGIVVIIERIVFNIVTILLFIYVLNKFLRFKKNYYLTLAVAEVIAITFNVLNLINGLDNMYVEIVSLVLGIAIPGVVYIYDYMQYITKTNILGLLPSKVNVFESGAESTYMRKLPMLESKDPADIVKWMKLNEDDIFEQLKNNFKKAESNIEKKKYKEGIDIYIGAETLFKENPTIFFNAGIAFMKNGNYQEAIVQFLNSASILEQQETDDSSSADCAFDRAKSMIQGIDKFEVYYNTALAMACAGKLEKAVEFFKKAGEEKGNWILVYKPLAIILEDLKRYEEAAKMYEKLSEYEPEDFESYGRIGTLFAFKKEYEKAILNYRKAANVDPNNPTLFYNLGILLYETGKYTEAIDKFRRSISLKNDDYKVHYNLSMALEAAGEKPTAVEYLKRALELKPEYTPASNNLAIIQCSLGNYEEAIEICKKALKYDPESYETAFNLGIAYMEKKDFDNAKKYLTMSTELNENLAEAYFALGQIAIRREEYPIAEENYLKAIEKDPEYPNPYYNLARIYAFRKEFAKVNESLAKAVELEPMYKEKAKVDKAFDFMRNMQEFKSILAMNVAN